MQLAYTPKFIKQLKKLPPALQEEALEKIELFAQDPFQLSLKTHKLQGKLKGRLSFSVNYKVRIVFKFLSTAEALLLVIGDHDVYQ